MKSFFLILNQNCINKEMTLKDEKVNKLHLDVK